MKSTASAAGGAVPAASPTSRRALLGALAASPLVGALALPALAEAAAEIPTGAIAAAPHPDAAMFVLRDRLAEAYEVCWRPWTGVRSPRTQWHRTRFHARGLQP